MRRGMAEICPRCEGVDAEEFILFVVRGIEVTSEREIATLTIGLVRGSCRVVAGGLVRYWFRLAV